MEPIDVRTVIPHDDGPVWRTATIADIITPVLDDELRSLLEDFFRWDQSDTVRPLAEWTLGIWRNSAPDPKAAWHDERQCNGGIHTYDGTQKRRRKTNAKSG